MEINTGLEVVQFESLNCAGCGVLFALTDTHITQLRKTGETFHCPNRHGNHFPKKKECLTDLANAQKKIDSLIEQKWALETELREMHKEECPMCGKRVLNLKSHNKRMHL